MQITTNPLRPVARVALATFMMLTCVVLASCERAASVIDQVGLGARPTQAVSFEARVVGITDGDTLTVVDAQNQQHTIRLAEIDAPERRQPWGDRSRQTLSTLAFGKTISVRQTDNDRYGRVVARLFVDGSDINRTMVEQGASWAYRRYLTDRTLIAAETRARAQRVGLWSLSDAETVAPWEWRQGVREGSGLAPETAAASTGMRSLLASRSGSGASKSLTSGTFSCSGKQYCRQMNSCAEANFYLTQCGVASLDGNSDGEPCEMLCGTASR
ncbi:thermonuclease family protein [Brevundimonas subvibrioides]|uniref:thermonuclease family protein n=1 Tax=Brevundimonas subvibrioides TaxID=74313 RepID=UPI0022B2F799|nr:thermonuclease family protein [Brevundimonas subvibrioides]